MSTETDLRRGLLALDRAEACTARLALRVESLGRRFSFERGYRVPLRREQLARELDLDTNPARPFCPPARRADSLGCSPLQHVKPDAAVEAGRVNRISRR